MRNYLLLFTLWFTFLGTAQEIKTTISDKVYQESEVDIKPKLMYGANALTRHIYRHFKAPKKAIPVPQKIQCSFIVEVDGTISNIKVLNAVDDYYKAEAVETLQSFNEPWYPAVKNNIQVRCLHLYEINLSI
jgi:hypothetical protein